jgi:hypothetical protein
LVFFLVFVNSSSLFGAKKSAQKASNCGRLLSSLLKKKKDLLPVDIPYQLVPDDPSSKFGRATSMLMQLDKQNVNLIIKLGKKDLTIPCKLSKAQPRKNNSFNLDGLGKYKDYKIKITGEASGNLGDISSIELEHQGKIERFRIEKYPPVFRYNWWYDEPSRGYPLED